MTVEPLPLPDDARFGHLVQDWPTYRYFDFPRSKWLRDYEAVLREHYPNASRKRLNLTARLAAPFPLALPGAP